MSTLNDVYRKFGEASEAAQLLETELGTLLLKKRASEGGLFLEPSPSAARDLLDRINKSTLGQLLKGLSGHHALDKARSRRRG